MIESSRSGEAAAPPARLRVLVFTLVFPNPAQPVHGTFVFERIRHLATIADVRVVAPVPWHLALRDRAHLRGDSSGLAVAHPIFWYPPKVLWSLRAVFLFLSALREIRRLRASRDFDLIDAHFAFPDGFAAILLGGWFRRPVCVTLRGTIVQWSKRPLGRFLCNWAIRRAARVIAVSETLAERARAGGVPDGRLATIANGVDAQRFRLVDRVAARQRLGLPAACRLVVSVGHVSPRKGFHRVIQALPAVVSRCPDLRFAVVGGRGAEEDNSAALSALAARLGLAERVLFAGAQPPETVALWLAAADVFVLASDFEGCPNVVLEAMACGRPVVATKVGDMVRMVPDFAGVLFDDPEDIAALADALLAALAKPWDAEAIRAHVAARSWDAVAQRVAAQWQLATEADSARAAKMPAVLFRQGPAA